MISICQCGELKEPNLRVPGILECPHCDRRHTLSLLKDQCTACVALDEADGKGPKTRVGKK